MAKIIKATDADKAAYAEAIRARGLNPGFFPLFGFVEGKGLRLAVEDCNEPENNIRYEVIAPRGFHFGAGELLHTKFCANQSEVKDCIWLGLEPCDNHCGGTPKEQA